MALFAIIEVFAFARSSRPTFPLSALKPPEVQQFFAHQEQDTRVLNIGGGNMAMAFDSYDIWGYDPVVLGRYMAFMAWSQNLNPDYVTAADVQFRSYNRLYAMLRCHYVSVDDPAGRRFGEVPGKPLPHVLLVHKYSVLKNREDIFAAMNRKSFDPGREVVLESDPGLPQVTAESTEKSAGQARVVSSTSDTLTIEAKVLSPAILLVTDSYSKDWKAWGLPGSVQLEYSVLPANYVLRAIPLTRGRHLIRMQYLPPGFEIGMWVSLVAWIIYGLALACSFSIWRERRPAPALPADNSV
jgi:hypothetical protein